MNIDELTTIHDRIAADAGLTKCRVRCETCNREQSVEGAHAMRHGWPTCCGYTMTLLTPAALKAVMQETRNED